MSKIKKLPAHEARKIAAGEVVERPANIVKELIENSIDAESNTITIYLEQAGKKLVRIIDDGYGMSSEDAELCFARHATSKINCIDDLNSLSSLGFRGEALSSISAISKVKLITNQKETLQGTCIIFENGELVSKEAVSSSVGTDITIQEIFYNVPARLKFLKKDESELRQILQLFQSFCLCYPNIHFKLYHDNKLIYNCPKTEDLQSRITQLWDHNLAQNMVEVFYHDESINLKISGLISNHQLGKFNRSQIFFFVNKRWVKNQVLYKALIKGYINVLPKDKFPAGLIFISIPSNFIDVNIHPRKEEVQFLNSKKIENSIQENAKKALENNLSKNIQSVNLTSETTQEQNKLYLAATKTTFDFEQLPFFEPTDSLNMELSNGSQFSEIPREQYKSKPISQSEELFSSESFLDTKLNDIKSYEIIGQYKYCYILLEKNEGMFIIDQHAAHERILYELFSKRFNDVARVKLIFPSIITLSEQNLDSLLPYFEILENYGIEAECFSKDQLVIKSIPVHLKDISLEEIINQLISWIKDFQYLDKSEFFKLINEKLCAQMACKAAIKAGDKLNNEQMIQLLEDLQNTENRFACPHGRPTGWLLNHNEIEKKFKRKL